MFPTHPEYSHIQHVPSQHSKIVLKKQAETVSVTSETKGKLTKEEKPLKQTLTKYFYIKCKDAVDFIDFRKYKKY